MGLLDLLRGRKDDLQPIDISEVYDASVKDRHEPRLPNFSPQLVEAIQRYLDRENVRKAEIFVFEQERHRLPDYYVPYYWSATYNMDRKNYDAAKEILKEGIDKCLVKSVLCRRLGECCFWSGDVEQAVYWFCTSIMAGDQVDHNAYLFLGYMYDAYGMKKASWWARRRARGISYSMISVAVEYTKPLMERIKSITKEKQSDKIRKMLATFYTHAKPVLGNL